MLSMTFPRQTETTLLFLLCGNQEIDHLLFYANRV